MTATARAAIFMRLLCDSLQGTDVAARRKDVRLLATREIARRRLNFSFRGMSGHTNVLNSMTESDPERTWGVRREARSGLSNFSRAVRCD
jgi:hypothetical protein